MINSQSSASSRSTKTLRTASSASSSLLDRIRLDTASRGSCLNSSCIEFARPVPNLIRISLIGLLGFLPVNSQAETPRALGFDPYITFSGNFDAGYRHTQFFESDHSAFVGDWDSRLEAWLPPFRTNFSWSPYLRIAGIASSKDATHIRFENAWLAAPGGGFQFYPLSLQTFREKDSVLGHLFGPLRRFGEYNRVDYWGSANNRRLLLGFELGHQPRRRNFLSR